MTSTGCRTKRSISISSRFLRRTLPGRDQADAGRSGGVSEGPRGAVPRPRAGAAQSTWHSWARIMRAGAKISDADIADYYERNKARWTKDKKVQPLAEVKAGIAAELALVNGMYAAADEAKKAHDTIYQKENFDAYAAQKKLTVRNTGLFPLSAPPRNSGRSPISPRSYRVCRRTKSAACCRGKRDTTSLPSSTGRPLMCPPSMRSRRRWRSSTGRQRRSAWRRRRRKAFCLA